MSVGLLEFIDGDFVDAIAVPPFAESNVDISQPAIAHLPAQGLDRNAEPIGSLFHRKESNRHTGPPARPTGGNGAPCFQVSAFAPVVWCRP
jgi:hypothetical protein